eukprot:g80000.t1
MGVVGVLLVSAFAWVVSRQHFAQAPDKVRVWVGPDPKPDPVLVDECVPRQANMNREPAAECSVNKSNGLLQAPGAGTILATGTGAAPNLNDDVVLASLTNWPVLTIASSASARSIFSHETAAFTLAVSSTLQLYQVSHLGSQTNLRLSSGATLFLSDSSILTVNGSVHMYAGSMAGSGLKK